MKWNYTVVYLTGRYSQLIYRVVHMRKRGNILQVCNRAATHKLSPFTAPHYLYVLTRRVRAPTRFDLCASADTYD